MTKYVDGKKYRVTVDAVYEELYVSGVDYRRFAASEGATHIYLSNEPNLTAEPILDPLPTAPNSVIDIDWNDDSAGIITAVRGASGLWYDAEGDTLTDEDIEPRTWTLVRDNGAK